jgi:hypothetical protein
MIVRLIDFSLRKGLVNFYISPVAVQRVISEDLIPILSNPIYSLVNIQEGKRVVVG